jgi:hypothetical protein
MSNHFSCPRCQTRQPLSFIFKNLKNNTFICSECNSELKPILNNWVYKQWVYTPILGFSSVVIPANIALYYFKKSFLFSITLALLSGLFVWFIYLLFVYKTTKFKIS